MLNYNIVLPEPVTWLTVIQSEAGPLRRGAPPSFTRTVTVHGRQHHRACTSNAYHDKIAKVHAGIPILADVLTSNDYIQPTWKRWTPGANAEPWASKRRCLSRWRCTSVTAPSASARQAQHLVLLLYFRASGFPRPNYLAAMRKSLPCFSSNLLFQDAFVLQVRRVPVSHSACS